MNLILFDDPEIYPYLLPLTYTRPVADLRVGILRIAEKWPYYLPQAQVSFLTQPYLAARFPATHGQVSYYVNGAVLPDKALIEQLQELPPETSLFQQGRLIALRSRLVFENSGDMLYYACDKATHQQVAGVKLLLRLWDIFGENRAQIISDFPLLTRGRQSQPIQDKHTIVYAPENVFLEEGVKIQAAVLNGEYGPIYLGKNTHIDEGVLIRGAFALCEGSTLNMGAKMRGDTTIGPYSKMGGEVSNSVVQGYSNKGHEGFLGNSVLGEWCNLGADTNNSNLKNNYSSISVWSYKEEAYINSGKQFCGLMMGDHSKCGINTMLNTGTVVGVAANIFGGDFPPKMVPSFAWGGAAGFSTFEFDKVLDMAGKMMQRRGLALSKEEVEILAHVYSVSKKYRSWEND